MFSQEIYGDNGRILVYQIKIYKMLASNYGCVDGTYQFTCNDTVFTSLVKLFYADNRTTIRSSFINYFMT